MKAEAEATRLVRGKFIFLRFDRKPLQNGTFMKVRSLVVNTLSTLPNLKSTLNRYFV